LFQLVTENEGTKVILLTNRSDPDFFEDALRCGASGIFERERPVEYIPLAIRRIMDGGFWFEQSLAERMLGSILHKNKKQTDPEQCKIAAITARDRQVLEMICEGKRNKDIAERLQVSATTISRQVTAMFRKLQVEDRTSLVIYAIKRQLVTV
jgi:DNA-binding NarL/FixJ family response regulator